MDKKQMLRGTKYFFEVNPIDLESFEEFAEYLESMLSGPCAVWEVDQELILTEIKARVDTVCVKLPFFIPMISRQTQAF